MLIAPASCLAAWALPSCIQRGYTGGGGGGGCAYPSSSSLTRILSRVIVVSISTHLSHTNTAIPFFNSPQWFEPLFLPATTTAISLILHVLFNHVVVVAGDHCVFSLRTVPGKHHVAVGLPVCYLSVWAVHTWQSALSPSHCLNKHKQSLSDPSPGKPNCAKDCFCKPSLSSQAVFGYCLCTHHRSHDRT